MDAQPRDQQIQEHPDQCDGDESAEGLGMALGAGEGLAVS
jgi:hypothetical protein